MRKAYYLILALMVLSLTGCGGSSNNSFVNDEDFALTAAQVAVISSPALQKDRSYRLIKGAELTGMYGAQYYVSPTGSEARQATLNLGFNQVIGSSTLIIVDDDTDTVVFAYDPGGEGSRTSGTVRYDGGTRLRYSGLNISSSSFFSAMSVDISSLKVIQLNGSTATINGTSVANYDYVWHADPDHRDEYYTLGLNGTTEYTESEMLANVTATNGVYINRDIVYMTSSLDFTGTAKNDNENEYAAYYSAAVQTVVSNELGGSLTGPYIFATLPQSTGFAGGGGGAPGDGGGGPGGNPPGGGGNPIETPVIRAAADDSALASIKAAMTHTAQEAYNNPVLHITEPGVYQLQGTWNGQIWIDAGNEASSDVVTLVLNSVDVTCTVAPAVVFYKNLYECGPDDETEVASSMAKSSSDIGVDLLDNAGAKVIISDDTVNNFTGSNVYRMLKAQAKKSSVTTIDGSDVSQQKKRYKMDGAFYSFVSMAIGGGSLGGGGRKMDKTVFF